MTCQCCKPKPQVQVAPIHWGSLTTPLSFDPGYKVLTGSHPLYSFTITATRRGNYTDYALYFGLPWNASFIIDDTGSRQEVLAYTMRSNDDFVPHDEYACIDHMREMAFTKLTNMCERGMR
jgi:hypothetical protein